MQAVVCLSPGKGFEEFKEFEEFEYVGSWEEQILHVHRGGHESSPRTTQTPTTTMPRHAQKAPGTRPYAQGEGLRGRQEAAWPGGLEEQWEANLPNLPNILGTRKRGKFTDDDG